METGVKYPGVRESGDEVPEPHHREGSVGSYHKSVIPSIIVDVLVSAGEIQPLCFRMKRYVAVLSLSQGLVCPPCVFLVMLVFAICIILFAAVVP